MTKLSKETAREKFRSSTNVRNIHGISNKDPNYEYKYVATTFYEGTDRVERYIDKNWEVVYSDEVAKDDRTMAAGEKDKQSLRQKPVMKTARHSGDQYVLMRCHKDNRNDNETIKEKQNKQRFESMQKLKPQRQGRNIKIQGKDVDSSNINE